MAPIIRFRYPWFTEGSHINFACRFVGGDPVHDCDEVYQLSFYNFFLSKANRNLKIMQDECILKTGR